MFMSAALIFKWDLHEVKSEQTSALKTALAKPFIE
jgi:hypothetical protein